MVHVSTPTCPHCSKVPICIVLDSVFLLCPCPIPSYEPETKASIFVSRHGKLADESRICALVKGSSKTEYSQYTISIEKQLLISTLNERLLKNSSGVESITV